jgi:aryl carrier-like protein
MTHDQWCASLEPKVAGTLNLDKEFGDSLDFFIVMSSGCGIIGARGQGNYAAASTFQDAFARHRASKSLPIRTIDLGVIASEGYTAENQSAAAHVMKQGLRKVPLKYVFPLLSEAISNPIPSQVSDAQVSIGLQRIDLAANSEHGIADHTDSKFSHIGTATLSKERSKEKTGEIDICTALQNAAGHDIVIDLVQAALTTKLSRLLAMPVEELCSHRSVSSYGTDSLVAVELRNWTRKQLGAQLQTFELMSSLSIRDVAGLIAERSTLVPVKG